ncbi:hypothetical protein J6T93_04005 [bacterium]|nr:hypothetical protein [bacterium]
MKALNEHWEKLLFVVVLLIVLAVVGKAFTSQNDTDSFDAKGEAKDVKESALVGIPGLVDIAKTPAPSLERNVFTHDWLQRSTANQAALTRKWGITCDETGQMITYRPDADGDGIPNEWEQRYGLDWTNPADAEEDPDKDTFTNLKEYQLSQDLGVEVLPKDSTSPNVLAQDWRIGKIYHPERELQLSLFTKGSSFNFTYKGKRLPKKVEFDAKQFEAEEGRIFYIEKVEEINKADKKGVEKFDDYEITMKDGETGETFTCRKKTKSLESFGVVEFVNKDDANKKVVCKVGDEVELPMVSKSGKVTVIDVENKTVTVNVNDIDYTVTAE